ncbi:MULTISPECIES: DUF2249 domain-containing protein [Ectothiorhodospira]|uniref:DUF2249 domain-containing protein n=1 Tax=Ectothiorhodospira TaxID=1051 RepID=UPI001EE8BFFD|nr:MULTISPECIES: DUF2249 domain-containing protein [Ectothiorhodospira]MCG5494905.1 DUF2249 domain-containing protein [Ectothiorhodospira variabilis]MCG5504418.1 DUF2249 domain-containing protein [Ectothiorhodospira variabilis]MCG5507573.1 DUF2249 domain-containing protein [Ectothiorhodospira variabilis]MCG5526370.1 DUF2249 domain-containing protein [Ectothiorhodospira haloalkaliphila]
MGTTHVLDVCDLPPPEPMQQVLDRLPDLAPGDVLRMRHRREPFPLYPMLADMGFTYRVLTPPDVPFEILIWRADGPEPSA